MQTTDGVLLWLDADPGWSDAANAVFVKQGVRVSALIRRPQCNAASLEW